MNTYSVMVIFQADWAPLGFVVAEDEKKAKEVAEHTYGLGWNYVGKGYACSYDVNPTELNTPELWVKYNCRWVYSLTEDGQIKNEITGQLYPSRKKVS